MCCVLFEACCYRYFSYSHSIPVVLLVLAIDMLLGGGLDFSTCDFNPYLGLKRSNSAIFRMC